MCLFKLSEATKILVAKSGSSLPEFNGKYRVRNGEADLWSPLWMHMLDTSGITQHLVQHWMSKSSREALKFGTLDDIQLNGLAHFLGAIHDLGKATPLFQAHIASAFGTTNSLITQRLISAKLWHSTSELLHSRASAHPVAGQALLLQSGCPQGIAAVVGAHHGSPYKEQSKRIQNFPNLNFYDYYGSEQTEEHWDKIHQELIKLALQNTPWDSLDELTEIPNLPESVIVLWSGILIMADWISSNEEYFPLYPLGTIPDISDCQQRLENGWKRFSPPLPWQATKANDTTELYNKRFGFTPNTMQEAVTDAVLHSDNPGLFILEAPMGQGKTEAALAAAEILAEHCGASGVFFGLPTQATTNAMFSRVKDWAEQQCRAGGHHTIRLAHGLAELNDDYNSIFHGSARIEEDGTDYGNLYVHQWFTGRKQSLLSDFVVGTVDQLLLAALKQKHVMLRHLGLSGKVVIIDEVHAYDAYMGQYLNMALTWLGAYRVPVLLLSATLPSERRNDMVESYLRGRNYLERREFDYADPEAKWRSCSSYPLLTYTDGSDVFQSCISNNSLKKTVELERWEISEEEQLSHRLTTLLKDIPEGACLGIIVNTVRRSQLIYDIINNNIPDTTILLYHASYLATDRVAKEELIKSRVGKHSGLAERNRVIVIGTQVLEQSLDLDFDLLITDMCPIDLLLQRLGRLHRHVRSQRPKAWQHPRCIVLDGADGKSERGSKAVYGEYLLLRTRAFLPSKIVIPDDISPLVQLVYGSQIPDPCPPTYKAALDKYELDISASQTKANAYRLATPSRVHKDLYRWLDGDVYGCEDDVRAQAAVRDGEPALEVLALKRLHNDSITNLGLGEHKSWDWEHPLSEEEARLVARQRLRLPLAFSNSRIIESAIHELKIMSETLPYWKDSHLLDGELFLIFDENSTSNLAGYKLQYSPQTGLIYTKEADDEFNE